MRRCVFAALDTYSCVGGLQQFNRRVIRSLAALPWYPEVHLMRDTLEDLPDSLDANMYGHGDCHSCFIRGVLKSSKSAELLLLGHINLLPVGVLAKVLNRKLKLILFVHGDEVWNEPASRPRRWYELQLSHFLDRVVSVSDYTAGVMSREFRIPREKFSLLPNAVDQLSQPPRGPGGAENILVVTRLASHDGRKHIDSVLRAFALMTSRRPDAILEVIGDGVLRPRLEELAHSLNLSDRVVFHGRVSDEELAAAYARARLFVMPSNKEGFGIVFLEAWLRGLPVICGSQGASKEVISDGIDGFVTDPKNIESLAEKIELLLSDGGRAREMGKNGYEKVMDRYLDAHFRANFERALAC